MCDSSVLTIVPEDTKNGEHNALILTNTEMLQYLTAFELIDTKPTKTFVSIETQTETIPFEYCHKCNRIKQKQFQFNATKVEEDSKNLIQHIQTGVNRIEQILTNEFKMNTYNPGMHTSCNFVPEIGVLDTDDRKELDIFSHHTPLGTPCREQDNYESRMISLQQRVQRLKAEYNQLSMMRKPRDTPSQLKVSYVDKFMDENQNYERKPSFFASKSEYK